MGAAIAVKAIPKLHTPPELTVERILPVVLICILFDGGPHIGAARFREAAGPIALVGVQETFLTAAGGTVLLHHAFGIDWFLALGNAQPVAAA